MGVYKIYINRQPTDCVKKGVRKISKNGACSCDFCYYNYIQSLAQNSKNPLPDHTCEKLHHRIADRKRQSQRPLLRSVFTRTITCYLKSLWVMQMQDMRNSCFSKLGGSTAAANDRVGGLMAKVTQIRKRSASKLKRATTHCPPVSCPILGDHPPVLCKNSNLMYVEGERLDQCVSYDI